MRVLLLTTRIHRPRSPPCRQANVSSPPSGKFKPTPDKAASDGRNSPRLDGPNPLRIERVALDLARTVPSR
jgi:hypothetical protein